MRPNPIRTSKLFLVTDRKVVCFWFGSQPGIVLSRLGKYIAINLTGKSSTALRRPNLTTNLETIKADKIVLQWCIWIRMHIAQMQTEYSM